MGGTEYHITQVWCGVLHKVTFISNLLWHIRWGTPQETCWWQEVIPLVHLMALSDGCESHHFHNAKRNNLINMGAFPSSGIRGLDSNHHSFSDAELPRTYCVPWTYVSRWQFTLRSPSPSELNFTLTVVHTHTHIHTTPDPAQCLNVGIKWLLVPIILFLWHLLFLVFFAILSQQRFWSVSVTKLIKFQWVPYTPEGVCVGKAWCSAWPHSLLQSQTCPESAIWQVSSGEGWRSTSTCCFFLNGHIPHRSSSGASSSRKP